MRKDVVSREQSLQAAARLIPNLPFDRLGRTLTQELIKYPKKYANQFADMLIGVDNNFPLETECLKYITNIFISRQIKAIIYQPTVLLELFEAYKSLGREYALLEIESTEVFNLIKDNPFLGDKKGAIVYLYYQHHSCIFVTSVIYHSNGDLSYDVSQSLENTKGVAARPRRDGDRHVFLLNNSEI